MLITAADRERVASEERQELRTRLIIAGEIPPDLIVPWSWDLDQPGPYNMYALRLWGFQYEPDPVRQCFVLKTILRGSPYIPPKL